MKENEYPVAQIFEEIQRYAFVLPLCLILAFVSIFPLSYGIAEKKLVLALFFGFIFLGSLISLALQVRKDCRLSDQMLKVSLEELAEMEEGLSLLTKQSPSKLLH